MAGEFLENPLVSAIGNAMMASDPNGPVGSVAQQLSTPAPPPKAEVPKPAVTLNKTESTRDSMDVRQRYPQAKAPAQQRGSSLGMGANLPGVMSPEVLMHPETQRLLAQYGVSPEQATAAANNASPNMFITNPAAYEKHPVLSTMIERGLEGLAFTNGGRTVGESISNVARGMLDAQAARSEKYNNQLMMPFAQASQVAQLQNNAQEQALKAAQIRFDNSHADYYDQLPDLKAALTKVQSDRENDLKVAHNRESNFHLQQLLSKTPLDEEGQKEFSDMVAKAGGDPLSVDSGELASLISKSAQRKLDADRENKIKVASVGANARVTAAGAVKPVDHSYDDAKTDARMAYDEMKDFTDRTSKAEASHTAIVTEDGIKLIPGSTRYNTYVAEKRKALADAYKAAKDRRDKIASPGAGMTIPPKNNSKSNKAAPPDGSTYDPVTGTYN